MGSITPHNSSKKIKKVLDKCGKICYNKDTPKGNPEKPKKFEKSEKNT